MIDREHHAPIDDKYLLFFDTIEKIGSSKERRHSKVWHIAQFWTEAISILSRMGSKRIIINFFIFLELNYLSKIM
jgi:hypothetical protein